MNTFSRLERPQKKLVSAVNRTSKCYVWILDKYNKIQESIQNFPFFHSPSIHSVFSSHRASYWVYQVFWVWTVRTSGLVKNVEHQSFPSVHQKQEIKVNVMLWHALFCRLFGHSGACSACGQSIPASEMVMRAQGNVYHLKVIVNMWSLQNEYELNMKIWNICLY